MDCVPPYVNGRRTPPYQERVVAKLLGMLCCRARSHSWTDCKYKPPTTHEGWGIAGNSSTRDWTEPLVWASYSEIAQHGHPPTGRLSFRYNVAGPVEPRSSHEDTASTDGIDMGDLMKLVGLGRWKRFWEPLLE